MRRRVYSIVCTVYCCRALLSVMFLLPLHDIICFSACREAAVKLSIFFWKLFVTLPSSVSPFVSNITQYDVNGLGLNE